MRDFDKVIVYFFHVETPPGVWRRSSLLLVPYFGHRVDHEYANVRRDAADVQFCTYTLIQARWPKHTATSCLLHVLAVTDHTPYTHPPQTK